MTSPPSNKYGRTREQDTFAGLISLCLVGAVSVLALLDREIPPSLTMALGSAMTWLFIRTADARSEDTTYLPPELRSAKIEAWRESLLADLAESSLAERVQGRSPSDSEKRRY